MCRHPPSYQGHIGNQRPKWTASVGNIELLACLEALSGVFNACLPIMKPIFKELTAFGSSTTASPTLGKRNQGSRRPRTSNLSSSRPRNWPKMRNLEPRPSHPGFNQEAAVSDHSLPLSLSPHALSLFRMPGVCWSVRDSETEKKTEVHRRLVYEMTDHNSSGCRAFKYPRKL